MRSRNEFISIFEIIASIFNLCFSLKSPSVFMDVAGIDAVNPGQLGMTTDQWREWKRNQAAADELEDIDNYCD